MFADNAAEFDGWMLRAFYAIYCTWTMFIAYLYASILKILIYC